MVAAGVPARWWSPRAGLNGLVEWEVRDSGPGVAPELGDKIFNPLLHHPREGIGLGLAFVREIAHDHGGEVECRPR